MSQSKQTYIFLLFLMALFIVLAACGEEGSTAVTASSPTEATANALATRIMAESASNTSATTDTNFTQQIEEAKALWASHNLDDYTVTVRYSQPGWSTQFIDLTIQDGIVTDHQQECYPPRDCILGEIDPAEFTIDKLLIIAEYVGNLNIPDHPAQIVFNPTYGYPSTISYEDGFWSLTQFQPTTP